MNTLTKETIVTLLRQWINQRAGLEFGNYCSGWNNVSGRAAYRSESRRITQQKHDAETLLRAVEYSSITAEDLAKAFKGAYSGRLSLVESPKGWKLEYCTGQYFPTEYRAAVCAVLASALWAYHRQDIPESDPRPGDTLRAKMRRIFGRSIQSRWLD